MSARGGREGNTDDWGIRSDTAQLHLRWSFSDRERHVEPTIRWYRQTATEFYTPWILGTDKPASSYESSDSRLAAFHALTYGLKAFLVQVGWRF